MRCLPCSRQSIDRQSRTDALMPMGITGITASGTSGSEAFFFVLLGKSPLPKPLEYRAALLSVGVIVGIFDLFRQIVGNQRLHSILVAILDRLVVVPAFEPLVLIAGYLSAFAASRARRLGFFAGLLVFVASSPKNESFSHLLVTNRRIS